MENPQAFPSAYRFQAGNAAGQGAQSGMTLRDYFAAKAMQAIIINPAIIKEENRKDYINVSKLVRKAYSVATFMLVQREKSNKNDDS